MTYTLTVANTKQSFATEDGETLLDALLRNGVAVRYGCRRGKCATCKHYVDDGDYDNSNASAYALLDEDREEGLTLLCQTYPLSDCTVELREDAAGEAGIRPATPRATTGTIRSVRRIAPESWSVRLDLVAALHALPGQYVELGVPGRPGVSRTFSISSSPVDGRAVEVIVRHLPGGVFSGTLEALAPGTVIDVAGPFGAFFLRPSTRPAVLVGDEAGIGPLLSFVRYSARQGWGPGMRVVHVTQNREDLVHGQELGAWAGRPGFAFSTPSGPGALAAAVAGQISGSDVDLDVYIAGDPDFCDQALFLAEARGVNSSQIHVERFYPAQ